MKKSIFIALFLCLILLALAGCAKRIDYSLPDDPVEFIADTFTNPADENDEHLSLEYNGRVYILYGKLKSSIDGNDVGKCVGYYVQDGRKMEDVRFFLLADDENAIFLVSMDTAGVMNQLDFFRAVDTKEKNIDIPE